MSGGTFNYEQHYINSIADEIEHQLSRNGEVSDYGYLTEYSEEVVKEFQNAILQLRKAYIYAHRVDWLLSGDDDEADFHERLREELRVLENQNG